MAVNAMAATGSHAMPMTTQPLVCPPPVLTADFDRCSVPGGIELWKNGGYFSPGVCFIGYVALCTQSGSGPGESPIAKDETAVRCVPMGYECNDKTADQRYAVSTYNDIILSAPAFEIRWRSVDVNGPLTAAHPTTTSTYDPAATSSPTLSNVRNSTSSIATSGDEQAASHGMPTGQIVGIVVGVTAAMCAGLGTAFVMWRRRQRNYDSVPRADAGSKEGHPAIATQSQNQPLIAELQTEGPLAELASNRPKHYGLDTQINKDPVELPADTYIRRLS